MLNEYEIKKENNGSSQISDFNCVVTVYYSACIMDGFDSLQGGKRKPILLFRYGFRARYLWIPLKSFFGLYSFGKMTRNSLVTCLGSMVICTACACFSGYGVTMI